jgi:signal transduction histidine kinase
MDNLEMTNQKELPERVSAWRDKLNRLRASIGTKIILPYLLLTLAVAGVGAFVVTNLVTSSLQERFNNQLLDAGRVVAEGMVNYEEERLAALRAVAGTERVPESLAAGNRESLAALVPQIIANSNTDAVELLDIHGIEVYGWQRPLGQGSSAGEERAGADFSQLEEVRRVKEGLVDRFGDKRVLLAQTRYGLMIFTVGPVYLEREDGERELVGTVIVGTYIRNMVVGLTERAVARVTLYDRNGNVLDTTLGGGYKGIAETLQESPEQYGAIIGLLQESPDQYWVVARTRDEVFLREVETLGQKYVLGYGDWRLRGQSFGLFSVALPSNFIVSAAAVSRNWLSLLFSIATVAVFTMGFGIAQRIIRPLNRLVQTSIAVAQGDLEQRTGIQRNDEIGSLAYSFDAMTERLAERNRQLAERNRQLIEQASELEAILNGIADGVIVLDTEGQIMTSNPAAQRVLAEVSDDFVSDLLPRLPPPPFTRTEGEPETDQSLTLTALQQPQRYQVGSRVLSALAAPVMTPAGEELRTVVVLRDVTREAEAEHLKDGFITSISHELRTPLTAIKGYSDLLMQTTDDNLAERQWEFVRVISNNTTQLVHHINKLIDISEIQAGNLGLQQERLCFPELVTEVIEHWRKGMEAKDLTLRVRSPGGRFWVYGDRDRLMWAIDNLLSNAYNYTLAGGRVEVRVFRQKAEARIDVTDTGIGIATADQPYLFTRFFRANSELTFSVRGVGLGLFITRSITELHGGRAWAKSELGVGSTFSLALPLVHGDTAD